MARVNSLLSIVMGQGANELRLVSDREPKMYAYGAQKKLSIPQMTDENVRMFLGEILEGATEEEMRANGRADVMYEAEGIGTFKVTLTPQAGGGLSAIFVSSNARRESRAARSDVESAPVVRTAVVAEPPASSREAHASERGIAASPVFSAVETAPREFTSTLSTPFISLVSRAAAMRASDLHLADGEPPTARVDGVLRLLDNEAEASIASMLGLSEHARTRSIELSEEIEGVGRVRIHAYSTADGLACAVRLLPPQAPTFASLDMPIAFDDLVMFSHGLVLVCGATGSGKSTTLAALAQEALRKRSIVLVTLEDPIEYKLSGTHRSIVRRRQVGRDVSDFASGLRDALREDPDVLLVGEMRDSETIAMALTAAETGHLVLASIHSRSCASAIERICDSYASERQAQIRTQLADSLRAIVGQRLVPRARGGGRVPAVEILRGTRAVASMVREGKTAQIHSTIQSSRREGMITLERCLAERVKAGDIKLEDARAAANDPETLAAYAHAGSGAD